MSGKINSMTTLEKNLKPDDKFLFNTIIINQKQVLAM